MSSKFNQSVVLNIAQRAAYRCSNPECDVSTVGPNQDPSKSTIIGEACHIYGAQPNSARYDNNMSDYVRSIITNAIWLCRNCHKKIDRDEQLYPADLLLSWREIHEKKIASELGNDAFKIRATQEDKSLNQFQDYPPIIRRMAIDKPPGWEWLITAELMRYINAPAFRKLQDLRDGLYTARFQHIDEEEAPLWIAQKLSEAHDIINPISGLMNRLTDSWGEAGEPGDLNEIHHILKLIQEFLSNIVNFEEEIYFTKMPEKFQKLNILLRDLLGSQADKLHNIPYFLETTVEETLLRTDIVEDAPIVVEHTVNFDVPKGWTRQFDKELEKATGKSSPGCLTYTLAAVAALFLLL